MFFLMGFQTFILIEFCHCLFFLIWWSSSYGSSLSVLIYSYKKKYVKPFGISSSSQDY